jgi:hypothetical protein
MKTIRNPRGNTSKCKLGDAEMLKHLIAAILIDPSLSTKQLSRLTGIGTSRVARLLQPAAIWCNHRWILRKQTKPCQVKDILREKVLAITHSLKNMKPLDVAIQHGVTMGTVLGIIRGKYKTYTDADERQRVRVGNVLKFYDEKGYEPSGASIRGALEVSHDGDQIKCHECGGWFENLNSHIHGAHALTASEYKKKHGLKQGSVLIGESARLALIAGSVKRKHSLDTAIKKAQTTIAAMRAAGFKPKHGVMSVERRNQHGNCAAQIAYDLRVLCEKLGRTPTIQEVRQSGINYDILCEKYGTVQEAVKIVIGSLPRKQATRWYSNDELIAMLKAFGKTHKRPPFRSDLRRGMLPNVGTFQKRFGSWNNALKLAGFNTHADGWIGVQTSIKAKRNAAVQNGSPLSFAAGAR